MRGRISCVAVTATVALGATGLAHAVPGDSYNVSAKIGKGGTKAKPKPVAPVFSFTGQGPTSDTRPGTPKEVQFVMQGLRENGGSFPKCTAAQIDAAQSDKSCPKGSAVATGGLHAKLGPEGDKTSNAACSKDFTLYNSGKHKTSLFVTGDPAQCAGVGYLPPIAMPWKAVKGGTMLRLPFPQNISHPLPGLEGSFDEMHFTFKTLKKKKAGKTVGYLESVGCKGTRKLTVKFLPETSDPTESAAAKAGSC